MPEVDPTTGMPLVDSRGRPLLFMKKFYWEYENTGKCTLPSGVARDISVSYPDNPDANQIIPNPTPKLPGNIGIGEGVKPLIDVSKNFDNVGNNS